MRIAWAVLIAVHALVFGWAAFHTGFYHDDWTVLELVSKNGMQGIIDGGLNIRRMNAIYYPALYSLFGMNPRPYQLWIFLLDIVLALTFYELMVIWLGSKKQAFIAAMFAVLLPIHAASHHWLSTSPQTIAVILTFVSFLAIERTYYRSAWSWLAWAPFAWGLMFYESVAFLPMVLIASRWQRGKPWLAIVITFFAPALGITALMHSGKDNKPVEFSSRHFVKAYVEGLKCVTAYPVLLGLKAIR